MSPVLVALHTCRAQGGGVSMLRSKVWDREEAREVGLGVWCRARWAWLPHEPRKVNKGEIAPWPTEPGTATPIH
jgi:hypothetical protein